MNFRELFWKEQREGLVRFGGFECSGENRKVWRCLEVLCLFCCSWLLWVGFRRFLLFLFCCSGLWVSLGGLFGSHVFFACVVLLDLGAK